MMLLIVQQHRTRVVVHQLTPATLRLRLLMMMLYLIYLAVLKDVEESMMMQKSLTLTDSQQMAGEAGMDDAAYCATTLHKSSCASADPSDTETITAMMMLYLINLE